MILVTGGTGFIGSVLVRRLQDEGHKVSVLTIPSDPVRIPKTRTILADITDRLALMKAMKDVRPETVVHLAGIVSYSKPRQLLFRINAEGTRNMLEACPNAKRFILSSSVSVYGEVRGIADESYRTNPPNPYGESKLRAEEYVQQAINESGISATILRIAPIYGKGAPSWLKNLMLMEKGFPIPTTKNLTHVVHISDVVDAFVLAASKKAKGTFNIADKEPVKFMDFAGSLMKLLGRKPKHMPLWLVSLLARTKGMKPYLDVLTMNRNYDITRARQVLGFRPKADLQEKTREMVEWYKAKH